MKYILGLGIDEQNVELCEACREYSISRGKRAQRICDYLSTKGISVAIDAIQEIAGDGVIGRPHFAQYLQEHSYVKTREEAFKKYLNTKEFKERTDRVKPKPEEAIELIHKADKNFTTIGSEV